MTKLLLSVLGDVGVQNIEIIYGGARLGDVKRNFPDISKAHKQIFWKAKV